MSTVNNSVLLHWWRGGEMERCWYLTAKMGVKNHTGQTGQGEEGHWRDWIHNGGWGVITAVHLGCKSVTIPMDPKRSKGKPSSAKQESGRIWVFHCSYNRAGGGEGGGRGEEKGEQVPAQYWILVYWIWLWLVGKSGAKGAGKGMSLSCRGRGRRRGPRTRSSS